MTTLTSRLIISLKDNFSGPARGLGASMARLRSDATRTNAALMGGGGSFASGFLRQALAIGAGYVGMTKGIGGTVGAAIKFEEAFADVRKVVNGTPAQLSAIRSEILAMSKDLPVTAEGISAIYAAAGQSNIPINELGKFSEMVAKVSVAWETTESETSSALAKIKNQLHMSVSEIGLYADAINHISNNSASTAPDLVDFSKRVAANGEMFGFAASETLAFGGAMIAAGGQTEVAATSFRNMGRALTIGTRVTKMQRTAFTRLGLDSVKTAKNMQKNALKTTLDVLDRIQKLPAWERISIASALFGDEARALMPVIANSAELRRQLGLVADQANYAGSSFQEYMTRAETSANALQILGNKIRGVGIDIGNSWLPTLKQFALGVGDVLDTLNKRVGVLDEIKAGIQGFAGGFGYGGTDGVRQMMNDLGDLIFGKAFAHGLDQADDRVSGLARISNRMRTIGKNLREFAADISAGNISASMGSLSAALKDMTGSMTVTGAMALGVVGWGLLSIAKGAAALAMSTIGRIAITAIAVAALIDAVKGAGSLGELANNLSNLSALEWAGLAGGILMVIGPVSRLAGAAGRLAQGLGLISAAGGVEALAGGGEPNAPKGKKPKAPKLPSTKDIATTVPFLTTLGAFVAGGAMVVGGAAAIAEFGPGVAEKARKPKKGEPAWWLGIDATESRQDRLNRLNAPRNPSDGDGFSWKRFFLGAAAEPGFNFNEYMKNSFKRDEQPANVNLLGTPPVSVSGQVETRPTGVQAVRITNPQPAPNITVTVHATTNASPQEIAGAVEQRLSATLNSLSRAAYSDGVE